MGVLVIRALLLGDSIWAPDVVGNFHSWLFLGGRNPRMAIYVMQTCRAVAGWSLSNYANIMVPHHISTIASQYHMPPM